jgi:hypothetical protein
MPPRARISVWAIVIPVAVLLVAYIIFAVVTYRAPPAPSTPTPRPTSAPQPAPTATPATSSRSVTGTWTGTLSQQGGPFTTYTFSMNLTETAAGAVSGTARADVANQSRYYVVESVTGQVSGSVFTFRKGSVLQSNPAAQTWCIDAGELTLSADGSTMSGTWTDEGCGSGPVALTRVSSTASAAVPAALAGAPTGRVGKG